MLQQSKQIREGISQPRQLKTLIDMYLLMTCLSDWREYLKQQKFVFLDQIATADHITDY